jgi:hypothetical protein
VPAPTMAPGCGGPSCPSNFTTTAGNVPPAPPTSMAKAVPSTSQYTGAATKLVSSGLAMVGLVAAALL